MIATNSAYLKVTGLVLVVGVPALLWMGLGYDTLSLREALMGFAAWFAALMIWTIVAKQTTKKRPTRSAELAIALDERTRKRMLRGIWFRKAWMGVLVVSLPLCIANGVAQRAGLPTLVAVGINLLWMYVTFEDIRRRRERIRLSQR